MVKKLRFIIATIKIISGVTLVFGLLLNFSLKNDLITRSVLPYYPSYKLAQDGLRVLEDMKFRAKGGDGGDILLGILDIDQPSWGVFVKFIQSDIAFLKSERNKVTPDILPSSDGPEKPQNDDKKEPLEDINWDRIKTISAGRIGHTIAGGKPITPPYRLYVVWPPKTPRSVYEFYSFNELKIDLNTMLTEELEWYSATMALISFIIGLIAVVLRRYVLPRLPTNQDQD